MDNEVIIYAMKLSAEANKRNLQYIKAILNNWSNQGIKNLVEAQNENQTYKNKSKIVPTQETETEKLERKTRELEEAMKNANK